MVVYVWPRWHLCQSMISASLVFLELVVQKQKKVVGIGVVQARS